MNFLHSFHDFWVKGGFFMWGILAILVFALAIIIERSQMLMRYRVNSRTLWAKIKDLIQHGNLQEALSLCKRSNAPLPRIFYSGLQFANASEKKIQNAVDEVMLEIIPELEKRTGHLTILANISTLIGLVGTIFGLRLAFEGVAMADPAQKASILAAGISEALNATAFGLLTAILVLLSYSFLQAKIGKTIDEIDQFSVKFINLITERKNSDGSKTLS